MLRISKEKFDTALMIEQARQSLEELNELPIDQLEKLYTRRGMAEDLRLTVAVLILHRDINSPVVVDLLRFIGNQLEEREVETTRLPGEDSRDLALVPIPETTD